MSIRHKWQWIEGLMFTLHQFGTATLWYGAWHWFYWNCQQLLNVIHSRTPDFQKLYGYDLHVCNLNYNKLLSYHTMHLFLCWILNSPIKFHTISVQFTDGIRCWMNIKIIPHLEWWHSKKKQHFMHFILEYVFLFILLNKARNSQNREFHLRNRQNQWKHSVTFPQWKFIFISSTCWFYAFTVSNSNHEWNESIFTSSQIPAKGAFAIESNASIRSIYMSCFFSWMVNIKISVKF